MKRKVSDAEFVNKSVKFFNERIDPIISQLCESNLNAQKIALENEKQIVVDLRNYWKLEHRLNCNYL